MNETMSSDATETSSGSERDGEQVTVTLDDAMELLAAHRRRYALYHLQESDEPATIEELTDRIAAREARSGDATASREVAIDLQHKHLPKLASVDVVEYDVEAGTVELADGTDLLWDCLDVAAELERPNRTVGRNADRNA